jgi:sulfopyruvate decarboxylase subunit alpha/phosphonopyruvate decarboxylase
MPTFAQKVQVAKELCRELMAVGFGPFLGTPSGILSPFYSALSNHDSLLIVARDDNAIGVAAGASLAGQYPVVLMESSGLGQSVTAIASLVVPYRIPMLLVVSSRGANPEATKENLIMGRLTEPLLDGLGIEGITLDPDVRPSKQVNRLRDIVRGQLRPAALLVPQTAFGGRT